MQFHGAAQRGRCWAEDPGDALGKESACSVWLVVFLQPFVTSAAGEDELKQPGTPQHGESSSRSWTRASTSRAPSPSPAGGQCFSEPSRTPARRARLHCPHRTQGAICCVPSCPPWLECVFHGPVAGTHRLGLGSFQGTPGSHWARRAATALQLWTAGGRARTQGHLGNAHHSGTLRKVVPGPPKRGRLGHGVHLCRNTVCGAQPSSPLQRLQGARGKSSADPV